MDEECSSINLPHAKQTCRHPIRNHSRRCKCRTVIFKRSFVFRKSDLCGLSAQRLLCPQSEQLLIEWLKKDVHGSFWEVLSTVLERQVRANCGNSPHTAGKIGIYVTSATTVARSNLFIRATAAYIFTLWKWIRNKTWNACQDSSIWIRL